MSIGDAVQLQQGHACKDGAIMGMSPTGASLLVTFDGWFDGCVGVIALVRERADPPDVYRGLFSGTAITVSARRDVISC